MNINEDNKSYFEHIRTLKEKDISLFLKEFSILKDYKEREQYLKDFYSPILFDILINDNFIKAYYVDSQAKYIFDKLKIEIDISILKTLVYCYNTNAREHRKNQDQKEFESKMTREGFIKINPQQKEYDKKKVICYTELMTFGLMDSSLKVKLIEGKLLYSDSNNSLMILPKGKRTRGAVIRDYAYIKEIK